MSFLNQLNAQDEVASMMEDDEVLDQLEDIGRSQRINAGEKVSPKSSSQQKQNMLPAEEDHHEEEVKVAPRQQEDDFEDLLEASMDGGMIEGMEQSFDFNPPEAVHSQGAPHDFEADFANTLDLDR